MGSLGWGQGWGLGWGQGWSQGYLVLGRGLGFSFVVAALPVATLLILLGVFRRPAWVAGLAGLGVTFLVAVAGYRMPVGTAVSAAVYGAAFGLFPITWIIFWAIALFRVTVEAGQFETIKHSISRLTPDPRLQALLIGFAFGGFLEGAAGFGTPVAIAATMLVGLGFSPFRASAICLLANTVPVAFGSIGIPLVTLAGTTGLPIARLSADVGAICAPVAIVLPVYLVMAMGGLQAMAGIWVPAVVAGVVFGLVQLGVSSWFGPQLADILAAIATMGALVMVLRLRGAAGEAGMLLRFTGRGGVEGGVENEVESTQAAIPSPAPVSIVSRPGRRAMLLAWMPYGLLVGCVLLWGWGPWQRAMSALTVVVGWPGLDDVVRRMPPIVAAPSAYHARFTLNWLAAAGTACMVATLLSVAWLRLSGRLKAGQFVGILGGVARQLRLPTAIVTTVLGIAFLMNYCGATATLGLGFAATGRLFPLFSALLGWVGVFLTGSDTSANALFGNLQVVTAGRLGFDPVLMAAANSSGGVMGKMISLQTIAIAAAATGLSAGEQSRLFRFTLRHSLVLALLTGCVVLGYAYGLRLG